MHDNIDDFNRKLHAIINQENIYNKLRDDIHKSEQSKEEKITNYEQFDDDKYNPYLLFFSNDVPFYLNCYNVSEYIKNDFTAYVEIGKTTTLVF